MDIDIKRTHDIADRLGKLANEKCAKEIEKVKMYCDGYIQGVEDYAREMRNAIHIKAKLNKPKD